MKRIVAAICLLLTILSVGSFGAYAVEQKATPNYKVAFFAFDCFNMQDKNGKCSGYGYEMMQGISKYIQCTFSYVGYDETASKSVKMLQDGAIDIYTAAKKTPEREKIFAFSVHPSITSFTCMNVKIGNNKIVSGDYSTYNGIRVGLLRRHTYNGKFLDFVKSKGFDCEIVYYETPTELEGALVTDEVDALVNSYIRIPEDEKTVESFGETPYYLMTRKEDQDLINQLDNAIDRMNIETPNWRTELYNKYYGTIDNNLMLTYEEQQFLKSLRIDGGAIRAVMNPDNRPYSWYEDGKPKGIVADIFISTIERLGLKYEIVPVSNKYEYEKLLKSGAVDVWLDMDGSDSYENSSKAKYKATSTYLETTTSVLRTRSSSESINRLVICDDCITMREIVTSVWSKADIVVADSLSSGKKMIINGEADGVLLLSYAAQRMAREDVLNRLRVDIVPDGAIELTMGVNADASIYFHGILEKTLIEISNNEASGIVQEYLGQTVSQSMPAYLLNHPALLFIIFFVVFLLLIFLLLYFQSVKSKREIEKTSLELAEALEKAEEATQAKQDFFSKMSHDIRTPLNVVLGMTQIANKYKKDPVKLENALDNVTKEGNYLLSLINSILDVNQLEHGTMELVKEPFILSECITECAEMVQTLAENKNQHFTVRCDCGDTVVVGDKNRLKQILINIASNAIKYTDNGGHISLGAEILPNDHYRFICTDDGIGMSKEFIEHICEDYSRAEDSRISKIQGTGLGMSVVKGFTDLMGGTLTIHSKLNEGSTFIVEIPFPSVSKEESNLILNPSAEPENKSVMYSGKKVLLAEDNALNAEIATELLRDFGLTVDLAVNGKCCVECYEASLINEYFAIFMDMQMPVMDGITATKQIRESSRSDSNIPIYAMTANTFTNDRRSCREAGMDGYITKPISAKDFEKTLAIIAKN